ncbi:hypothetical protein Tco_0008068 [Tanacetum coccineum]
MGMTWHSNVRLDLGSYFDPFLPMNIITRKAYNTIMVEGLESTGKNLVAVVRDVYVFVDSFTYITNFVVLEDIGEFIQINKAEVVMGKPFRKITKLEYDCAKGLMSFNRILDSYTFQMLHTMPRKITNKNGCRNDHNRSELGIQDHSNEPSSFFKKLVLKVCSSSSQDSYITTRVGITIPPSYSNAEDNRTVTVIALSIHNDDGNPFQWSSSKPALNLRKEKKVKGREKIAKGSRKKMLGRKRAGKEQQEESSKKQKLEKEKESDKVDEVDEAELKKLLVIKKDEDIAIDAIPVATKLPVDY